MTGFDEAFEKTAAIEGGYVFDPDDAGGETYKGIARRFNQSWVGWDKIDEVKKANPRKRKLDNILDQDDALQQEVKSFYKQFYWDRFRGDDIPLPEIREELFDTSVNLGVQRAVMFLQEGLNLLNRNQKNYVDIVQDGLFGDNTLKALNAYLKVDDVSLLLKLMNIFQGIHYIEYMRKDPVQEKYARGWLKRVKL